MFCFQVGEIKAHAAEWKANVRAEFRETRRRLSVEVHDKLQRAATIRSMERRQLGLDQRAHSLDVLSHPHERRAANFNILDAAGHFNTSSQESINGKLNDNIFKLGRRGGGGGGRGRELKKNIPPEGRPKSAGDDKRDADEDETDKEVNTSLTELCNSHNGLGGATLTTPTTPREDTAEDDASNNIREEFNIEMEN